MTKTQALNWFNTQYSFFLKEGEKITRAQARKSFWSQYSCSRFKSDPVAMREAWEIYIDRLVFVNNVFAVTCNMREAWQLYIDRLCKDRLITSKQYNNWSNPF